MAAFLNTENAPALFRCEDLFVVTTLGAVHDVMVFGPGRSLQPAMPFDLLFFYGTVVETIAQHLEYSLAAPMPRCQKATAVNLPDFSATELRNTFFVISGIAAAYVNVVGRSTSADGIPFDVSYAAAISALAFDAGSLARIDNSKGKRYVQRDSWDDFLSGFNAP